jgi:hypothetical protein
LAGDWQTGATIWVDVGDTVNTAFGGGAAGRMVNVTGTRREGLALTPIIWKLAVYVPGLNWSNAEKRLGFLPTFRGETVSGQGVGEQAVGSTERKGEGVPALVTETPTETGTFVSVEIVTCCETTLSLSSV